MGYTPPEIEGARGLMQKMKFDDALKDVEAAKKHVASAGKTGIIGWCWGGALSFKAACNVDGLACAVAYYGGAIPSMINEKPKCPVMFHWGETDASIPLEKAKEVAEKHKDQIHYFYPGAGHGFNCEQRGSYNAESAKARAAHARVPAASTSARKALIKLFFQSRPSDFGDIQGQVGMEGSHPFRCPLVRIALGRARFPQR